MGKGLAGCLVVTLLLAATSAGAAGEVSSAPPEVLVRLGHLEQKLALLDRLWSPGGKPRPAKAGDPEPAKPPGARVAEFLKGTDWLDPGRAVVAAAVAPGDPQQGLLVLLPFRQPNPAFQAAYGATVGADDYLVRLPPGQTAPLPEALPAALRHASRETLPDFIALDLALSALLERNAAAISEGIEKLATSPAEPESPAAPLSSAQSRKLFQGLLDLGRQVERLTIGLDLSEQQLAARLQIRAAGSSPLAAILVEGGPTTLLDPYVPALQTTFRAHNFNLAGVMALLGDCCGAVYQQLGIDFAAMTEISAQLTGEMAGGVSYLPQGMRMELVSVLKPGTGEDFLEKRYLPWVEQYGESMARMLEAPLGRKPEPIFVRSPESTVAGRRVYGLKAAVPLMPHDPAAARGKPAVMRYEMRLATVDNLLLTAPDDRRMAELIRLRPDLKPAPSRGPLMRFEVDMGRWLEQAMQLGTLQAAKSAVPPRMQKLLSTVDFKGGEATVQTTFKLSDIKAMATFMGEFAYRPGPPPAVPKKAAAAPPAPGTMDRSAVAAPPLPAPSSGPQPVDAYALGALASAYGNDRGAIRHFRRVIQTDPTHAHAHFQLGVCLSQTGDHKGGLEAINHALRLRPETPLFFYGRGRTLLLSGETVLAGLDFTRAAEMGDAQAQAYLARGR